jgi:hypothetical protein
VGQNFQKEYFFKNATMLTRADRDRGEESHWCPEFLPGGRRMVKEILQWTT